MATSQLCAILLVVTCLFLGVTSQSLYDQVNCAQGTPLSQPGSGTKAVINMTKIVGKDWNGVQKRDDSNASTVDNSENCLTAKFINLDSNNEALVQFTRTTSTMVNEVLTKDVQIMNGTIVDGSVTTFVDDADAKNQYYFIEAGTNGNYFSVYTCTDNHEAIIYYYSAETTAPATNGIPDKGDIKPIALTRNRCNGSSTLVYQSLTTMLLFFFSMKYFL